MIVGLVGAGERVEALAALAAHAGNRAVAWAGEQDGVVGKPPDGVEGVGLAEVAARSDVVLVDVAPARLPGLVRAMAPGPAARVVMVSRGLEVPGGRRLSEIVAAESACLRVGALAGPIVAAEVRRKSPCAAVAASRFTEVAQAVGDALHSSMCRVYHSEDLAGVELAGALVEVVAAALGASRGLGMGIGLQALVVTRGIAEGARLCARAGGDPRTFSGLAGSGELVACLGLPDHPAQVRGLALARGEKDPELAALCEGLLARCRDLPITQGVLAVSLGHAKVADAMALLLGREQREELA